MRRGYVYDKEFALFSDLCAGSNPDLVLNVACGIGRFIPLFKQANCVNLDFSPAMLKTTKDRFPHETLVYADAFHLPFKEGLFSTVFSCRLIHHQRQPDKLLEEFSTCLKPHGDIIIDQTHKTSLPQLVGNLIGSHMYGMNVNQMRELVGKVGLCAEKVLKAFFLPAMAYGFIPEVLKSPLDNIFERVLPSRSFWRLKN